MGPLGPEWSLPTGVVREIGVQPRLLLNGVCRNISGGSERERERIMAAIVFLVFGAHVVSWIVLPSHRVEHPAPALTVSAPAMTVASATA